MLALQDILEDERRAGPEFISFASSTNAEVTREIKDTAHLISRFDKERELRIRSHKAAINKIWWILYHKRPDHPTPYHRNSPLPTPIPGPVDFNPEAPVFLPSEERERPNKRKRAKEVCKCPACRRQRMRRTVRTQTHESALVWSNQDPDPTTCLFQVHQQAHKDLVDTFVCCNVPTTPDELLQVQRPHLGTHRLAIVHTPQETQDPRVAVVFPLAIIRGHHGPPPVRWSELSLALVPAGTHANPEYALQCYECKANPECSHIKAFQDEDDMDTPTASPYLTPTQWAEVVGRGPKRQDKPQNLPMDNNRNGAQSSQDSLQPANTIAHNPQPLEAPYILYVEHTQIQYDIYRTPHALRGQVLQTKGFPDFKAATRKDMVDMAISTTRTIRTIIGSPRFQQEPSSFTLNRAMHQHGAAIKVHNGHLLLMSMGQDRVVTYTYFYTLGSRISINDRTFSTRDFWRHVEFNYKPPRTTIVRPVAPTQPVNRTFAKPNLENLLDLNSLFSPDDLNYIKVVNIQNSK